MFSALTDKFLLLASRVRLLVLSVLLVSAFGAGGEGLAPEASAGIEVRAWTATLDRTHVGFVNQIAPSVLDSTDLQNLVVTPVPEPDVVWIGSIGLALLALRFRFGDEPKK